MDNYSLSYVLTTYNKLEFIKTCIPDILKNIQADEELVVVDGGSSDGTAEYLQKMYEDGSIHQFKSEKDQGEGHGFNKAILMARGNLIKLLTDDDVFFFDGIRECKTFMLANPQIDFLNTHGAARGLQVDDEIIVFTDIYDEPVKEWARTRKPFAFCLLGAMFKKSSIPLLGLLNPNIKRADAEYSLRVTSQKIKMAWFSGVTYVRVFNESSNTFVYMDEIMAETEKLNAYYSVLIDGEQTLIPEKTDTVFQKTKDLLRPVYRTFFPLKERNDFEKDIEPAGRQITYKEAYTHAQKWMAERFTATSNNFISN